MSGAGGVGRGANGIYLCGGWLNDLPIYHQVGPAMPAAIPLVPHHSHLLFMLVLSLLINEDMFCEAGGSGIIYFDRKWKINLCNDFGQHACAQWFRMDWVESSSAQDPGEWYYLHPDASFQTPPNGSFRSSCCALF